MPADACMCVSVLALGAADAIWRYVPGGPAAGFRAALAGQTGRWNARIGWVAA